MNLILQRIKLFDILISLVAAIHDLLYSLEGLNLSLNIKYFLENDLDAFRFIEIMYLSYRLTKNTNFKRISTSSYYMSVMQMYSGQNFIFSRADKLLKEVCQVIREIEQTESKRLKALLKFPSIAYGLLPWMSIQSLYYHSWRDSIGIQVYFLHIINSGMYPEHKTKVKS